jgi:micrococcal nuclease
MRRNFFYAFLFFILVPASLSTAADWSGKAINVIDGDTLEVIIEGKQFVIELSDIDAPELDQPFGTEAKQFVEGLALNKKIKVSALDGATSVKGAIIAEIFVSQKQDSLNRTLVREGLAWPVTDPKKRNPYELAYEFAQKNHLGIWSVANILPPWEFRKQAGERKRIEQEKAIDEKILMAQIQKEKMLRAQIQNQSKFSLIIEKIKNQITGVFHKLIFYLELFINKLKNSIRLLEKIRAQ